MPAVAPPEHDEVRQREIDQKLAPMASTLPTSTGMK